MPPGQIDQVETCQAKTDVAVCVRRGIYNIGYACCTVHIYVHMVVGRLEDGSLTIRLTSGGYIAYILTETYKY